MAPYKVETCYDFYNDERSIAISPGCYGPANAIVSSVEFPHCRHPARSSIFVPARKTRFHSVRYRPRVSHSRAPVAEDWASVPCGTCATARTAGRRSDGLWLVRTICGRPAIPLCERLRTTLVWRSALDVDLACPGRGHSRRPNGH